MTSQFLLSRVSMHCCVVTGKGASFARKSFKIEIFNMAWAPAVTNWNRTTLNIRDHHGPTTRSQSGKPNGDKAYQCYEDEVQTFSPYIGIQIHGGAVAQANPQIAYRTVLHNVYLELMGLQRNAPADTFVFAQQIQYVVNPNRPCDVPSIVPGQGRINAVLQIPAAFAAINART